MDSTLVLCLVGGSLVIVIYLITSAIRVVPETQRLAVYRLGRYIGEKGPGLVFVIPVVDSA